MGLSFPGGIADDSAAAAYLQIEDELVAVDLRTGAVRWRQPHAGEALAASGRFVLTRRDGREGPVLELLDTEDGAPVRSLAAAQLPGLAAVSSDDALDALIRDTDEGLEIHWQSSRRYRGGAMPGMGFSAGGDANGTVLLEGASGTARAIANLPAPVPPPSEPLVGDADTIAAARLGDAQFALRKDGEEIRLEARSARGERRWSTALGRAKSAPPGSLRE